MNNYSPEYFFDLSSFSYKEIFDGVENVWEVLPKIKEYIKSLFNGKVQGNYKAQVFVGEGSIVSEKAEIVGPAIIGKNCTIGPGAYLREYVLLGDNVKIGHGAEVKNSIFLNNSTAAHLNYVGDSVMGSKVNIAGGAMFANYRFDGKPVTVRNGEEKIATLLQKFGAVIGDGSQIGANAVLNPGTVIGKEGIVYPLTSASGFHKKGEIIRS